MSNECGSFAAVSLDSALITRHLLLIWPFSFCLLLCVARQARRDAPMRTADMPREAAGGPATEAWNE